MTKKDLIAAVQEDFAGDLTKKKVGELVDALFNTIAGTLKGDDGRYAHSGFGVFTVKTRAARKGRNPRTGDSIDIPESKTVNFKPAPELKKTLN